MSRGADSRSGIAQMQWIEGLYGDRHRSTPPLCQRNKEPRTVGVSSSGQFGYATVGTSDRLDTSMALTETRPLGQLDRDTGLP